MTANQPVDPQTVLARYGAVPMDVFVELTRLFLTVREIAAIEQGMILRTRRRKGDSLELHVGDTPVAHVERLENGSRPSFRIRTLQVPRRGNAAD